MTGFAENGGILPYFKNSVDKTLFSDQALGQINPIRMAGPMNFWSDAGN
jgi:hypothetical protein